LKKNNLFLLTRNETRVAEENCWAITQAAGWGYAAAGQVSFMSESVFQLE
jgi:hypothetical protein